MIALGTAERGHGEVFIRPYPGPGGKIQLSSSGGTEPVWSREGREILYRDADRFMSVDVRATPAITVSSPRVLFTGNYLHGSREDVQREYDVTRDGHTI